MGSEDEKRDAAQTIAVEANRPIEQARPIGQADAHDDAEDERDADDQCRDMQRDEKSAPQKGQALERDVHHARPMA